VRKRDAVKEKSSNAGGQRNGGKKEKISASDSQECPFFLLEKGGVQKNLYHDARA